MFPNICFSCVHFLWQVQSLGGRKSQNDLSMAMFLLLQVAREGMFLKSKIGSCCVMDPVGSITSFYQVIQEYLVLSVGQGLQEIVSLTRSLDTLGKTDKHWQAILT